MDISMGDIDAEGGTLEYGLAGPDINAVDF